MKTLVILFCLVSVQAISKEFDYRKMCFDLAGVTFGDGKIIAYGDAGHVMVSGDFGETWNTVKIFEDSVFISKMRFQDGSFYGICHSGILFKTDAALNLISSYHGVSPVTYIDFALGENISVISLDNYIRIFDRELKPKQESEMDPSLQIRGIVHASGKLYLSSLQGKILIINPENSDVLSTLDISDKGLYIKQMLADENSLYLNLDNAAFSMNLTNNALTKLSENCELIQIYNDRLYDLRKNTNTTYNVSWIELYQNTGGTFDKITQDSIDRYVTPSLSINEYIFPDDNHIVAVGGDKTVYISENKGITWKLISLIRKESRCGKWIDKQKGFYISKGGQMFATLNGGVTWLPQKYTDTLIRFCPNSIGGYETVFDMDDSGTGFLYNTSNPSLTWTDSAKYFNCLYTKDFGNTYNLKWDWGFGRNKSHISGSMASQYPYESVMINGHVIFCSVPQSGEITRNNKTVVFDCDRYHNLSGSSVIDSISVIKILKRDNKLFALMWEKRYPCPGNDIFCFDSTKKWVASSTDYGTTWNFEFYCELEGNLIIDPVFSDSNGILLRTEDFSVKTSGNSGYSVHRQYYIDLNSAKVFHIYQDTSFYVKPDYYESVSRLMMVFDGHVYLRTKNQEIKKCSLSDIAAPKWENIFLSDAASLFYAAHGIFDSIVYSSMTKFTGKKASSVENVINNDRYSFGTPPYPQPAKGNVTFKIFTGRKMDAGEVMAEIFDINGIKISNPAEYRVNNLSASGVEVILDTDNIPTGIYFVKISGKNIDHTAKIIVIR